MTRKKRLKIPLYFGDLNIIQTDDFKAIEQKHGFDSTDGFDALCFRDPAKNGYSRYFLVFKHKYNPGQIAHESLHLVYFIYEDRGIKPDVVNDEPQCYLLGWVVGECHKFLEVDDDNL